MFPRLARIASVAFALSLPALPAAAAVVTEAEGQFSRHWHSPTEIGFGADTIIGTAERQNGHDFIALTGMRPGAQMLSLAFAAPDWALSSPSYEAEGQVRWSTSPFRSAKDGATAGSFLLSRWSPRGTIDLALGDDFGGEIYLGVYFTHGRPLAWSLSAPGNAPLASPPDDALAATPVPAVPLPAGVWLMLGALSALGALKLRRNLEEARAAA